MEGLDGHGGLGGKVYRNACGVYYQPHTHENQGSQEYHDMKTLGLAWWYSPSLHSVGKASG